MRCTFCDRHYAPHVPSTQPELRRNVKQFRGGLVFKDHRLVYHSTLGLRVTKKKEKTQPAVRNTSHRGPFLHVPLHSPLFLSLLPLFSLLTMRAPRDVAQIPARGSCCLRQSRAHGTWRTPSQGSSRSRSARSGSRSRLARARQTRGVPGLRRWIPHPCRRDPAPTAPPASCRGHGARSSTTAPRGRSDQARLWQHRNLGVSDCSPSMIPFTHFTRDDQLRLIVRGRWEQQCAISDIAPVGTIHAMENISSPP